MAAPTIEVYQKRYQNPHAKEPLFIPYLVLSNTPEEVLIENIKTNSARDLKWVKAEEAHDRLAVMVGGGPSINDEIGTIRSLRKQPPSTVFAMNAASQWLRLNGIEPDFQVISDAKLETMTLVDDEAKAHLFASQVNPATMASVDDPIVWHLEIGEIENHFPKEKVRRGGYALIGGGVATGNCAMCLAYALGYRRFKVFGFDSSHRDDRSHAYSQPMNDLIPTVDVEWAGKTYTCSVAMKAQAEKFQITSRDLKELGCSIEVYGDGLLQHMYNAAPHQLTERDKYRTIWQFDSYRKIAPGEFAVPIVTRFFDKPGPIIDFGCGTGRAALRLSEAGYDVMLVDFADNCRDDEALKLPFLEWDLSHPCPLKAPYGICCDVMEHIPTNDVPAVIGNIMQSTKSVFFQISTVPDAMGAIIHESLHMTVKPHEWWQEAFGDYVIAWEQREDIQSSFLVNKQGE